MKHRTQGEGNSTVQSALCTQLRLRRAALTVQTRGPVVIGMMNPTQMPHLRRRMRHRQFSRSAGRSRHWVHNATALAAMHRSSAWVTWPVLWHPRLMDAPPGAWRL